MGGKVGKAMGKRAPATPTYVVPEVPAASPVVDPEVTAKAEREKARMEERDRLRKQAIEDSGRASGILAGENENKEVLG